MNHYQKYVTVIMNRSTKSASAADRIVAASAYRAAIETKRKANALYPSLAAAAAKMAEAHTAMVEKLKSDSLSYDDIKEFVKHAQQFEGIAKAFAS